MAGGRPKTTIDYDTVRELASIMCTQEEIASVLSVKNPVSVRTLQRDEEFCRVYKIGLDNGKTSLRRKQFALADRNPAMAIWLGKQYLGQKEPKQEVEISEIENIAAIRNLIKEKANVNSNDNS